MESVAIVGLGYVGFSLAQRASQAGFIVHGVDTSQPLLDRLSSKKDIFAYLSLEIKNTSSSNVIVVCVPTPINKNKTPNLIYVDAALRSVGKTLRRGQLVIVESTVFPGYCDNTGVAILEKLSKLKAGKDFYLAHCPERVNPGDKKWTVANIPRVIGGINETSAERAKKFYSKITTGQLHVVSNMAEAEASKMIENTFRDINIAFVNEMARSFDGTDVNIHSVLRACATKPFGYMPFTPGMGVGGHCIPVDPYYLIDSAKDRKFTHSFLQLARGINDGMVDYVAEKIDKYIASNSVKPERMNIGLFGLTYKPDVADVRESQPIRLLGKLKSKGLTVKTYDPLVNSDAVTADDLLCWANIVVVAVAHDSFKGIVERVNEWDDIHTVFDIANIVDESKLHHATYQGIGI